MTNGVGIDQNLKAVVPLDLQFRDEGNRQVSLGSYFQQKPVVLALVYYRCPNLCNVTLNEMVSGLKRISLQPAKDYNVVAVSIDPKETPALAAEKKENYRKQFGRPTFEEGWHFLTGSQESISRLANVVGFHYRWDERSQQFVHAAAIMVATPEGQLSRYFYGVQYAPADLRMALVEAGQNHVGSPVDRLLLFCFHYDASQGKYTLAILNVLKIAGTLTVAVLGILIYGMTRRNRPEAGRVR
jgi:protein SCO1/2